MRWLKRLFATDATGDPIVKLIGALSEPEAQMRREQLEREGVPAMVKDMGAGFSAYGATPPLGFDLFVKQSDLERAEDILGPLTDTSPAKDGPSEGTDGEADG